jgi:glutamate-1-semialdehyde 2,1-aminomutase
MRATLCDVLTEPAFDRMIARATRYTEGITRAIEDAGLPWSTARLGARAEYRFTAPAPRTGTESAAAADDDLDEYLHLYLLGRGILLAPFHNMALMSPDTTDDDVDRHVVAFTAAVGELVGVRTAG